MEVTKRLFASFLLFLMWSGPGLAGPLDDRIEQVLEEYFKIHASLAGNSIDSIDRSASSIDNLVSELSSEDPAISFLLGRIQNAAREIQHQNLASAREQFFELTKPLLVCLHKYYSGEKEYFRYFCSKAKKAWIQPEKGTKNPYLGGADLTSGYLVQ
jgi:hypothetical protein